MILFDLEFTEYYTIANVKTTRTTIVFVYIIHEFNCTVIMPERILF